MRFLMGPAASRLRQGCVSRGVCGAGKAEAGSPWVVVKEPRGRTAEVKGWFDSERLGARPKVTQREQVVQEVEPSAWLQFQCPRKEYNSRTRWV